VRAKNLLYSVEDVRQTVHDSVCLELKPNFYKSPAAQLVKATQLFERLSLHFKGPFPSSTKNRYMLTVINEFSRFPFAFPCSSFDAKTVISCLNRLFELFGMPAYIHSDRGTAFMSHAFTSYLHRRGVACSKTSVYNAPANGQCEQYNGIIWSVVRLALASRKLTVTQWECVLPDTRSLLCTATNATLHERLFNYKEAIVLWGFCTELVEFSRSRIFERHTRSSKYEPLVEEVDVVHVTPNYACVCLSTGRETTVPL